MMKPAIRYALLAGFTLGTLCACHEQVPDLYSAPDGIYFNNRNAYNTPTDTTIVTFVYHPDDVETLDVPVSIQSLGRQSAEDRPVNIRVYSDNAEEHTDYELVTPAVMPAHTSSFVYVVRLRRTEALRTELKSVFLELHSNEYFTTFLKQNTTSNGQLAEADVLTYRIDFSDYYSAAPAGWRPEYVGAFSERKLRLLWKLFSNVVDPTAYNTAGAIPFNKWIYIQREVNKYLATQLNILRGYEKGDVDPDALVDPEAQGDERRLLDFTPIAS